MWETLCDTMTPFLWGGALALVWNIPLRYLENHLQGLKPKLRRTVALLCITAGMLGLVLLGIWLFLPQLIQVLTNFSHDFSEIEQECNQLLGGWVEQMLQKIQQAGTNASRTLLETGVTAARNVIGTLADMGFGVVLALYLLASKESNQARAKRFCLAAFGQERTEKITLAAHQSAEVFGSFIVGQCLEASILAGMFVVTLLVLRFPCAVPISVVIGVTALVPIFGAWIGGAVGMVLTLSAGIKKAIAFLVVFLVVQQVENQLIYPRVVGNRIGLPPMWVLAGVLLGGGILGPAGVFLGIPIMGVIYDQVRRWVHFRLDKQKKM